MTPKTFFPIAPRRWLLILAATLTLFTLATCGGAGGGGGDAASPDDEPSEESVTISGVVGDGDPNAPIPMANCRFIDLDGNEQDTAVSGDDGSFQLYVLPSLRGYILCSPQSMPNLILSTFASTHDHWAGDTITGENVTPATTVVADILWYEAWYDDAEERKDELLSDISIGQNTDLELVATMATRLYQAMLAQQVDAEFSAVGNYVSGDEEGDRSDGGGVGGDVDDGADSSPLTQAECTFVIGDSLATAEPLYPPALADYWSDGRLNRSDLVGLTDLVHLGLEYTPEEIQQAFEQVFPWGLNKAITTFTNDQGHYFLPIPAKVSGYVRCTPQGHENLILGTYVSARQEGEIWDGEDVTPATTVFSTHIVPRIEGGMAIVKENFLADIDGLDVQLVMEDDNLSSFKLRDGTAPENSDVGLVAFSVTILFNAFHKNDLDVDFPAAIADLTEQQTVDPTFLEARGVPADQTQALADLVNDAVNTTAGALGTDLATAFSTARVKVTTVDAVDSDPIPGAMVDIENELTCDGCGEETNEEGQLTLTMREISPGATQIDLTISPESQLEPVTVSTEVAPLATVDVTVRLGPIGTISGAVRDALEDTPIDGGRVSVYTGSQRVASTTTDSQGNYSVQCVIGSNYTVAFEMDGYISTQYHNVTVSADSPTILETLLQVNESHEGNGTISGTIRNDRDDNGIGGVSLQLRQGINNLSGNMIAITTTTADGAYQFDYIPAGLYTLSASHGNYFNMSFTVLSVGGQTRGDQDASMSPDLTSGEIWIVLSWGETPADLDSHLTGPSSAGDSFHCYFGDLSPDPAGYVQLDIDDRYTNGSETITIEHRLADTYKYLVHDYSNRSSTTSRALSNSDAQIKVYHSTGELASFNVPFGQGGTVWTVFELDGASGQISPQNTMAYESDPESVRQFLGENEAAHFSESQLFENLPEK